MATIVSGVGGAYPHGGGLAGPGSASLSSGQTGNGASTNTADRGGSTKAALLKITTVAGTTCTYAVEGSGDGVSWFNIPYATSPAPTTAAVANIVITTSTTNFYYLLADYPWRYVRITYSSNTGITNTVDVWLF
jgi:hypothetical protein